MDRFVVALVRRPHGLLGMFRAESTSGEYAHLERLKELSLCRAGVEKHFAVEEVRLCAGFALIKCAGIESPEEAKKYSGWEIIVPREFACPLAEGEYYIEDLKGSALLYEGEAVAAVRSVAEGGAGSLLEAELSKSPVLAAAGIACEQGGRARTVFVPFKDEFIGEVDTMKKTIHLRHLWILE